MAALMCVRGVRIVVLAWMAVTLSFAGFKPRPALPDEQAHSPPKSSKLSMDISAAKNLVTMRAGETNGGVDSHHQNMSVRDALRVVMENRDNMDIQCNRSRFYQIDGACNNVDHPWWGAAFYPFIRELPNNYTDGHVVPRLYSVSGALLPSPRDVTTHCLSLVTNDVTEDLHPSHNQNLMQFGQYFSHEFGLTPVMEGLNCCKPLDENEIHPDTLNGGPCFPIMVPAGDRHFHQPCMVFNRSLYMEDHEGVAQQVNAVTHFIDQSALYGSSRSFSDSIRTFHNGLLRVTDNSMLPLDNTQKCLLRPPLTGCPVGGDNRVNEVPSLTVNHLIFYLEHNRVARALQEVHPEWDDERVFQEARAIVIAETQHVLYEEYLPVILGHGVTGFFGLNRPASYDPTINPSLFNSFQTAAYRFGHSTISNHMPLNAHGKEEELKDFFFRPDKMMSPHGGFPLTGQVMKTLLTRAGQAFDPKFAEGVMDLLFLSVDSPGDSSDLPARNIQRGRDHGLPPFIHFLEAALAHFGNDSDFIAGVSQPHCPVYSSTKDVDLFLGGLFEEPVKGGVVGPTFAYLMGKQFKHLRVGDRLFFDSQGSEAGFTPAQIQSIKATSYAGMICRTAGLRRIQKNAFYIPHTGNPPVDCSLLPDVDFSLWR